MGYLVAQRGSIGRTEVIRVTADHKIIAIGDRRGDDTAAGY
jgi:gamma-glutamyltranspeptidase/glutathione hydrolase